MTRATPPLLHPFDPLIALGLLTRLPVRVEADMAKERGARSAWAYPLVGLLAGGIAAAVQVGASGLGLSAPLAALLALSTLVAITGALHEDGLADCADGFWGGWDPARRLEIMRDSRIGAYGVIALMLALSLRWQGMAETTAPWIVLPLAAMLSRAWMVAVWAALPPARDDGLARGLGRPSAATAVIAVAIAVGLTIGLTGVTGLLPVLLTAAGAVTVGSLARSRIGGQTGDVMGATQQVCEILCLLALAVVP